MIVSDNLPQVHLNFYSIFTMEKVAIESSASKDVVKSLIYDLNRAQGVLNEVRDNIKEVFNDLR